MSIIPTKLPGGKNEVFWIGGIENVSGNGLAHVSFTFGAMNPHDPIFIAPPITEIPDYVWSRQYDKPAFLPGRPVQKPQDTGRKIPHPDAETALQAAKRACRAHPGRWFGRASGSDEKTAFLVYEDGKVIERHLVGR